MNIHNWVSEWLLAKSKSYLTDSWVLQRDGDREMSEAYQTVSDELAKCAKEYRDATS